MESESYDRQKTLWFGEINEPDFRNLPPVGKVRVLAELFKSDSETNNFFMYSFIAPDYSTSKIHLKSLKC